MVCDRENCWDDATVELRDQREETEGFFCARHAEQRMERSHYRLHVVPIVKEKSIEA